MKKIKARRRRHNKVRARIKGIERRLRLSVFKSNRHIYAQIIDDAKQITLAAASDLEKEFKRKGRKSMTKVDEAKEVGKLLAKRVINKKIKGVVFDRGGYRYTGRVRALATGSREGGLKF